MSNETKMCLRCGIHIFPGMSHFCKKDRDEEFLKPLRDRLRRLENAEVAIKNVIESNLRLTALSFDLIEALTVHIYKDLLEDNVSWALKEIAYRKETLESLKLP